MVMKFQKTFHMTLGKISDMRLVLALGMTADKAADMARLIIGNFRI